MILFLLLHCLFCQISQLCILYRKRTSGKYEIESLAKELQTISREEYLPISPWSYKRGLACDGLHIFISYIQWNTGRKSGTRIFCMMITKRPLVEKYEIESCSFQIKHFPCLQPFIKPGLRIRIRIKKSPDRYFQTIGAWPYLTPKSKSLWQ